MARKQRCSKHSIRTIQFLLLDFYELADQKLTMFIQLFYPWIEQQQRNMRSVAADAIFNGRVPFIDAVFKGHLVLSHTGVGVS